MIKWLRNIGPGTLIAAAFIGPGTVTLCTIAGVQFGFNLLWALTLSIIATIVLQDMAARIGIITNKGLVEVIKENIPSSFLRKLVLILIISAVIVGNGAYEAGNISGASLGISAVLGQKFSRFYPLIIGTIAFGLLFIGNYKVLERILILLVLLMSISFILAAVLTKPNISELIKNAFIPTFPDQSLLTIIGLIGTTVVPYNLFLHASIAKEKWQMKEDVSIARKDTIISVILGGLVSMAILISAAAIGTGSVSNIIDLAKALEPVYGSSAKYLLGVGLFAAGITSAITAPLAAAYVANSCFGWNAGMKDVRFRLSWSVILVIGVVFSTLKFAPIEIIKFAQIANGILLPLIGMLILWIVNKSSVLGTYINGWFQNILSVLIILITVVLGLKSILKVIELL
ncbi:Nramp family divalent metal transporter [Urechidicola vernalis]|uniref:Nramp family divalent metal transporter n=1 Tax=Urechidicola vernalis TaxID=3075600 RepID=A0ABU2Y152_9FLAO|nr:Nramp family divalent metal transporter [Urechidicola sp. P050]MDT0551919.1 Nramp family divalent metal transporter [Urechidicola sp. P050]